MGDTPSVHSGKLFALIRDEGLKAVQYQKPPFVYMERENGTYQIWSVQE